jgi:hypothetical protein
MPLNHLAASGIGPLVFGFARDQLGLYKSTLHVSIVVPACMAIASVLMPSHGRAFDPRAALQCCLGQALFARVGGARRNGDGGRFRMSLVDELPGSSSHREMVSLLWDGVPGDDQVTEEDLEGACRAGRL